WASARRPGKSSAARPASRAATRWPRSWARPRWPMRAGSRAAGLARQYRMAEELGQAALAYAGRFTFDRGASDRHVIPLLQDARAMLGGKEGAGPVRAQVLAHLAVALRDQPDRGPRDAHRRGAVALARASGDPPTLAYTLSCRLNALMGPGDPQERLAIAEELRAVARAVHDTALEGVGEYHRAMVL